MDERGFCHQHPGQQLLNPPYGELFRGRRAGMRAQRQVQQPPSSAGESAELPAPELCRFLLDRTGPPGQTPSCMLSPASPALASLRIQGPPWDPKQQQKKEADRQEESKLPTFGIPHHDHHGLVAAHSRPQFPHVTRSRWTRLSRPCWCAGSLPGSSEPPAPSVPAWGWG